MKSPISQVASVWFPESKGGTENVAYNLMPQSQRLAFEFCGIVPGSERVEHETANGFRSRAPRVSAIGTPVLVMPVGGLPEVVADFPPAMVLAGRDASAIATGIAAVLTDTSSMPSAEACRTYARTDFDWGVVGRPVADVYREVSA